MPETDQSAEQVFHKMLKRQRKSANLTQAALAKEVGLTQGHLNRIENGRRPPPSPEKVLALIKAMRLPAEEAISLLKAAGYEDFKYFELAERVHRAPKTASFGFPLRNVPPYTNPVAELVAEALGDTRVPAQERMEMEKQIASFVRWLLAEAIKSHVERTAIRPANAQ